MTIAFLVTSAYQLFHYRQIARHLDDVSVVIEVRDRDFGISEDMVKGHIPNGHVEWVSNESLHTLDGRYEAIVCQTPILPLKFLDNTKVIAQQYSLAKERYQYGVWRTHADMNLMYGPLSVSHINGFSNAVAVGNPMMDGFFQQPAPQRRSFKAAKQRPRLLYMPTYGSLSSMSAMAEQLGQVDADVTIKLHHAEANTIATGLPKNLTVVFSDTDPVELLREHDGVLSDFSGAIFDALYAKLPVLLTGQLDPGAADYDRLSEHERDQSQLTDVTGRWEAGQDLIAAFAEAETKIGTDSYNTFIDERFTNPGTAGEACAREIRQLLGQGGPENFGAQQVRETTRRYITTSRELRAAGNLASATGSRRLYQRARRRLARVDGLRKLAWTVKRRKVLSANHPTGSTVRKTWDPRPAHRREAVGTAIEPFFTGASLTLVRDGGEPGAARALRATDKRALMDVLGSIAAKHPRFAVAVGKGSALSEPIRIKELTFRELLDAHWIEIGDSSIPTVNPRDTSGYVDIQFVELHPERKRYLATKTVPDRPDWTPLFVPSEKTTSVSRPGFSGGPVDVVYTWVDSNDPAWEEQYARFSDATETQLRSASNAERFIDRQELKYSLRSLWAYAPFVRNIYIVTADQHPAWLSKTDDRVKVVSHKDIFPDMSALPTFNSHAIEACLHRIPGLSENFIYFNDDVFVGREVTELDFFTSQGLSKVRLSPSQYIYEGEPEPTAIPTDWAAYNSTQIIERDFGAVFDRRLKHVPFSLKRSVYSELEERYADLMDQTRAARFRSRSDIAVASMLSQFYGIATHRAVEWADTKHEYVYLDTGKWNSYERFKWIIDRQPKFYCLNTTRFTEVSLPEQARNLAQFFEKTLPQPAPWEVEPTRSTTSVEDVAVQGS